MKTITFNLYKFTELQPGIQLQIIKNNTLLYKEKYFEMIESNFTNVGVDLKIKDFTIVKFEPFIDIIDIAGHILMYEDLSPGKASDFFKNVFNDALEICTLKDYNPEKNQKFLDKLGTFAQEFLGKSGNTNYQFFEYMHSSLRSKGEVFTVQGRIVNII